MPSDVTESITKTSREDGTTWPVLTISRQSRTFPVPNYSQITLQGYDVFLLGIKQCLYPHQGHQGSIISLGFGVFDSTKSQ